MQRVTPLPLAARALLEATLPVDPLAGDSRAPEVEVLIPCSRKDAALLSTVVTGAVEGSANSVARVRVICPMRDHDVIVDALGLKHHGSDHFLTIEHDEQLLGDGLMRMVEATAPEHRRGWLVQQLVKFISAATTDAEATLVVDSDTVLLRRRMWVTESGVQLLPIVREFHRPYAAHAMRVWGADASPLPVSFVAHHMLLQRDVLQMMLGGDPLRGLQRWVDALDWSHTSAGSEYHSYGTWLLRHEPNRVALAQWANVSMAASPDVLHGDVDSVRAMATARFPKALSISFHDWLPRP